MMDKLELTGQTWAEFSTVEVGYVYAVHLLCSKTIQPNLKLKTVPKQLLGSVPLDIVLPG